MKKVLYILAAALTLGFAACTDQGDVVDQLIEDVKNRPIAKQFEYTLTAADYAAISKAAEADAANEAEEKLAAAVKSGSLNSFADPVKYIAPLLGPKYPALGAGSAIQVAYKFTNDKPEYLAPLAASPTYVLSNDDYASVWGAEAGVGYLTPANSPSAKLPAILKAARPEAVSGDIVFASYKYSDQEPVLTPPDEPDPDASILLNETFDDFTLSDPIDKNGWKSIATVGTKHWTTATYSGAIYAFANAYNGANEVSEYYLISPQIDLSKTTNNIFTFDLAWGFYTVDCMKVMISDEATAATDPSSATWEDITASFTFPANPPERNYTPFGNVGSYNLDTNYAGKKIYIAFKYNGQKGQATPNETTAYEIDNFLVAGIPSSASTFASVKAASVAATRAVIAAPVTQLAIYTYNGSAWVPYTGARILNAADYTAMGSTYGNLTPDQVPTRLPEYLARNVEYASAGTKMAVVYALYASSATTTVADEYEYDGATWNPTAAPVAMSDQFVYAETGWIFDPSITYTMTKPDHMMVVHYIRDHSTLNVYFDTQFNNMEWYFGFSENFNNVNIRVDGSTSSRMRSAFSTENDTELHELDGDVPAQQALLWERLENEGMPLFLSLKFPDTPAISQGVPLHYNVHVDIFGGPDGVSQITEKYIMRYKVLTAGSAGNPPTFEFVSKELQ